MLGNRINVFRLLLKNVKFARIGALVALILVSNVLELLGLSLFVPIIDLFQGKQGATDGVTRTLSNYLVALGIPPVISSFLILLSLLFFVKMAVTMWLRYQSVNLAAELQGNLRDRLYKLFLESRIDFINKQRQGNLLGVLGEHTVRSGQAFFGMIQIVAQWVTALTYAVFVLLMSWRLTLVALALGLGMSPVLKRIGRRAHHHGREFTLSFEDVQHVAMEGLHAKKTVNAMNWAAPLVESFHHKSDTVRNQWKWTAFWSNSPGIVMQPISVVILSLIIWLSLKFNLSVSHLGAFSLAFIRLLPIVQAATSMMADLEANKPSIERVFGLIDDAEKASEPSGSKPYDGLKKSINLNKIRFRYDDHKPVLDGLSFEIQKGSMVALIGPSGAGKTTVADLILGLYRPEAGCILIDDTDLRELNLTQYRSHIAYVSQDPVLFHDTIRNNLLIGLARDLGEDELRHVCEKAGAWEFIAKRGSGLDEVIGDRGVQLSGGQRQRLALARALLRNPEILILDEATSALDNESEQWIKQMLRELQQSGRFTIIVIAHRYTTIQHADVVYEIKNGQAISLGENALGDENLSRRGLKL